MLEKPQKKNKVNANLAVATGISIDAVAVAVLTEIDAFSIDWGNNLSPAAAIDRLLTDSLAENQSDLQCHERLHEPFRFLPQLGRHFFFPYMDVWRSTI